MKNRLKIDLSNIGIRLKIFQKHVVYKMFLKNVCCQQLVKNDAGEAWDPSRKMRLEKWCLYLPENLSTYDLYDTGKHRAWPGAFRCSRLVC